MKKLLALLLALLLLAACGCASRTAGNAAGPSGAENSPATPPENSAEGDLTPQAGTPPEASFPAAVGALPFTARRIRTDGYHEGLVYPRAVLIGSAGELEAYILENQSLYSFGETFTEAAAAYDEAWFAGHQLILAVVEAGSGSVRYTVTDVTAEKDGTVTVQVAVQSPEVGTADMAEWHLLIELEGRPLAADAEIAVQLNAEDASSK